MVSLRFVGLSPCVTDDGAEADGDADEAGRDMSRGAAAAAATEEASLAGSGLGARVSLMLGCSKSHETPCLEQLPQRGCTSSHLIFLILQRLQPTKERPRGH